MLLNSQKLSKIHKISLIILLSMGVKSYALAHAGTAHSVGRKAAHLTISNSVANSQSTISQASINQNITKQKVSFTTPTPVARAKNPQHLSGKKIATLNNATPNGSVKNAMTLNSVSIISEILPISKQLELNKLPLEIVSSNYVYPPAKMINYQNKKRISQLIKFLSEYGMTLGGSSAIISALAMLINYRLRKRFFAKIIKQIKYYLV